jgi:DNA adenine methylase
MIAKYWSKFNLVTKDHFYHSGAKEENRNAVVEALVMNFDPKHEELQINACSDTQPELFDIVAA